MLQNKRNLAAMAAMVVVSMATAAPTFVPSFDGKKYDIQGPAKQQEARPRISTRELYDAVQNCWPEPSYFRGEIVAQGRLQNSRAATLQTDGQIAAGGRINLALVVTIPLYSALEIDRERTREYRRRTGAADAVGLFVAAIADRQKSRRELALYRALESRAKERVAIGVTGTEEQVVYMEKVAKTMADLIAEDGAIEKARLTLLSQCAGGLDRHVDALLLEQMSQ